MVVFKAKNEMASHKVIFLGFLKKIDYYSEKLFEFTPCNSVSKSFCVLANTNAGR